MDRQVEPTQEVENHSVEYVFRHVVYSRLKSEGFEERGPGFAIPLKSGKDFGVGMVKGDLEVICYVNDGFPAVSVLLPVDNSVRGDMLFKRLLRPERSVLVCYRTFPSDDSDFESAENIEQMVEECWPAIEEIIKHGEMILHYHQDKIYPDSPSVATNSFFDRLRARIIHIVSCLNKNE